MKRVVKIASVASLYAATTIALAPISYDVFQVRIADALMMLPSIMGFNAVVGLAVGCAIANVASPFGVIDVVFGALTNFLAGLVVYTVARKPTLPRLVLASILSSVVTASIIGYFVLHLIAGVPLLLSLASVFVGSIISIGALGVPLATFLKKVIK
ncbi:MAG: QueT transporter family protein [Archaeoglobaceae archaeon]